MCVRTATSGVGRPHPSIVTTTLLAIALLAGGASSAGAQGSISGTAKNASNAAIPNLTIQVYSSAGVFVAQSATSSDGLGVYTVNALPAGSYYVRTNATTSFINEVYNDIPCVGCTLTTSGGFLVVVTNGATTGNINFVLATGGRITGIVTNAAGGAALPGVTAQIFNDAGSPFGGFTTNASGVFTSTGLPAGPYFVRTSNTLGFVNQLYDSLPCPVTSCSVTTGAPVDVLGAGITTSGVDFALLTGGLISGQITNAAGGAALQGVFIQIYNALGTFLGSSSSTDASGNFVTPGLPNGQYFIRTSNSLGFVDELYDGAPCVPTCIVTNGVAITVSAGTTQAAKNFALDAGGSISGTVKDANSLAGLGAVTVQLYTQAGLFARSASTSGSGVYTIAGLPAGPYYARTNVTGFYQDELYNELPCVMVCTVTDGLAIVVTAGATQSGKDFTLTPGAGVITGTVRDGTTLANLPLLSVRAYTAAGTLAKSGATNSSGVYVIGGLQAGTYYVRTSGAAALNYVDELFSEMPCAPSCTVTDGASIVVSDNATQSGKDFTLAVNLIHNGTYSIGITNWTPFAQPTIGGVVANVTNGLLQFQRIANSTEAEVIQATGVSLPTATALDAGFELGNTDSVRKRIKILIHDLDFTDSASCTFFLDANAPLRTYRMRVHTTKAWTNATMTFYGSTVGTGGFYQVDNVSLQVVPGGPTDATLCFDPTVPGAPGGAAGADLLVNGNFDTGALSPPWSALNAIVSQVTGGVLEFRRSASLPAPVILQLTGQTMVNDQILTATFQLGNSSANRHRTKILIHDVDFGDAPSCVFWIPPGQPLQSYTMRVFTTKAWANASVSIYPSTGSTDNWTLLDNVTLQRSPGSPTTGTTCLEGLDPPREMSLSFSPTAQPRSTTSADAAAAGMGTSVSDARTTDAAATHAAVDRALTEGARLVSPDGTWVETAEGWSATATEWSLLTLYQTEPMDLTNGSTAHLTFESWLSALGSRAEVQVSVDGIDWITVSQIAATDTWQPIDVDLGAFLGEVVQVRFAFDGVGSADANQPDVWRVRDVRHEPGP